MKTKKSNLKTVSALFLLSAVFSASAVSAQTVDEVIDAYKSANASLKSMKCEFVEKKIDPLFDTERVAKGDFYYKKPQKMIWEYKDPYKQEMVIIEESGWVMMPEIKQVQKVNITPDNASRIFTVLGFGDGDIDLRETFDASLVPSEDPETLILELIPKDEETKSYFTKLHLSLDTDDMLPKGMTLWQSTGERVEITFSDRKLNAKVKENLFEFDPPKDYEIVDYSK